MCSAQWNSMMSWRTRVHACASVCIASAAQPVLISSVSHVFIPIRRISFDGDRCSDLASMYRAASERSWLTCALLGRVIVQKLPADMRQTSARDFGRSTSTDACTTTPCPYVTASFARQLDDRLFPRSQQDITPRSRPLVPHLLLRPTPDAPAVIPARRRRASRPVSRK